MAEKELTPKQKRFCSEYIIDWNGTRAAIVAGYSQKTARQIAVDNLSKLNVKTYIEAIQKDIEKQAGISQMMVLQEYMKIAFSNIADLHNTWIDRNDFDQLTEPQKAAISEIDTRVIRRTIDSEIISVEQVKIKLHDKQKALTEISRMLGYNAPEKFDHTSKGDKITGFTIKVKRNES